MKNIKKLLLMVVVGLGVLSLCLFDSCKKDSGKAGECAEYAEEGGQSAKYANTVVLTGYMTGGNGDDIRLDVYVDTITGNIVSILFDGEEPAYLPECTSIIHDKLTAYNQLAILMEQYPCVKMVRTVRSQASSYFSNDGGGEVVEYIIFYDDFDENGDCWFENL